MLIIEHRINDSETLQSIPVEHGVEIDLRSDEKGVYLSHDPFTKGEYFDNWLKKYNHAFLVLNVKEDGLESAVLELLKRYSIDNYFFLDQPFPTQYKCSQDNISVAFRYSQFEQPDSKNLLSNMWLWVDSFSDTWEHLSSAIEFAAAYNMKICLVSPELHGRYSDLEIQSVKELISQSTHHEFSVCTKLPRLWNSK
jgi:hypothetical protein